MTDFYKMYQDGEDPANKQARSLDRAKVVIALLLGGFVVLWLIVQAS